MRKLLKPAATIAAVIFSKIRSSSLTRTLLIILLIKFLFFYGFLKGFLYPRYLKPRYESAEHRSQQVTKDLLNNQKEQIYDRKH
jgi:F0F1-type ATP synthase membrane subunit b/b'